METTTLNRGGRMRRRGAGPRSGKPTVPRDARGETVPAADVGPAAESEPVREGQAEAGEARPDGDALQERLLDRLLYKGVLPRYAFPTDVATFYVFDLGNTHGR